MEDLRESEGVQPITSPVSSNNIASLVRLMLETYIQHSGGEEMLEDVLEEIDTFLNKQNVSDEQSQ
jgi:hypothetical protein